MTEGARRFGAQCVVASIDAKRDGDIVARVHVTARACATELDAVDWARECVARGAGEILLDQHRPRRRAHGVRPRAHARRVGRRARAGHRERRSGNVDATCATRSCEGGADAALVAGIVHDGVETVAGAQARHARRAHPCPDGRMTRLAVSGIAAAGGSRVRRARGLGRSQALPRERGGRVEGRRIARDRRRSGRRGSRARRGCVSDFRPTASSARSSASRPVPAAAAGCSIRSTERSRSCAACRCGDRSSRSSRASTCSPAPHASPQLARRSPPRRAVAPGTTGYVRRSAMSPRSEPRPR